MTIKLGVVMDPIADINYKKDTTMAMLWAAQARDWQQLPNQYLEDLEFAIRVAREQAPPNLIDLPQLR